MHSYNITWKNIDNPDLIIDSHIYLFDSNLILKYIRRILAERYLRDVIKYKQYKSSLFNKAIYISNKIIVISIRRIK